MGFARILGRPKRRKSQESLPRRVALNPKEKGPGVATGAFEARVRRRP